MCNDTSGACSHKVRLTDVMRLGICSMFICSSAGQLKWSLLMANFQHHGISPMPNQLRQLEQTKVTCFLENVNKRHTTSYIPICLISGRNAAWKLPRNPSFHVIDLALSMAAQCTFSVHSIIYRHWVKCQDAFLQLLWILSIRVSFTQSILVIVKLHLLVAMLKLSTDCIIIVCDWILVYNHTIPICSYDFNI